ncbi:PVC-type heme-binding CxxCH protein [Tautonia plasticadhaerens]|uniref:Cytochrome c n=1 Tax=Tautonia plasticadhaerens TaxID=2527974 RepID=A0A518GVF9_9BACT|nr:PVC-type heme-binding CxxCH protein [Tautonia plasticadhaerens]QDV32580.1 Cytochrome c [Tautonia plasticadhaerens]
MTRSIALLCLAAAIGADRPPTLEESRAALSLADPSLTVELVACEPDVMDPVAIAWDEFGRLFVAEMGDYPVGSAGGRIKRMVDHDGDGQYEDVSVFAEGLPYPSGVLPWAGGLLVTAAPDLLHLKDTDDDGRADTREVILTGFGEGNQQLRVNSPTWGIDNRVYLANGRSGGLVRRPGDPPASAVPIPRNDLRVRPETGEFEPITGFSQFGLPRDDWGDRFPSWNTVPLRHVVLDAGTPGGVADILDLEDGGRIFSLAPTQQRFNAESVSFFNASCGPVIERGGRLGDEYLGDAFVCEPLTGVVHRRQLDPVGPTYVARRVEQGREFLASSHRWFRPVNLANGPDGALYVVDFCRAWVEHPDFVPEDRRASVDFAEGRDRGRIWRIVPKELIDRPTADLPGTHPTPGLVADLGHPIGWIRDTAQRLLAERDDPASIAPLRELARQGPGPLARVLALWTLESLGALDSETVQQALVDPELRVREAAARLASKRGDLVPELIELAEDPDDRVRLRVAGSLGGLTGDPARQALARLASIDAGSRWMVEAVIVGIGEDPLAFLESLFRLDPGWRGESDPDRARFLTEAAELVGVRDLEPEVERLLRLIPGPPGRPAGLALLLGLARGQGRVETPTLDWSGTPPESLRTALEQVEEVRGSALRAAADPGNPAWIRALALEAAIATRVPEVGDRLTGFLGPVMPPEVQAVAARGIGRIGTPDQASLLLEGWDRSSLATRRLLLGALATRAELAGRLLEGVEDGTVSQAELDPMTVELIRLLDSAALDRKLREILGGGPGTDRDDVVRRFAPAIGRPADPPRGRSLFSQHCRGCHARDGQGADLGPDLGGLVGRPADEILLSILDPSRDVPPDGAGVIVATLDGQVRSGLVVEEGPEILRLRMPEGVEEVIPRGELEALRPTGRSLMPEGFERVLSPQDLADLIAYLRGPSRPPGSPR